MRILYIDIDSMRPRHFGCYGYHRNTTPNLDAVAREGVRFPRGYCASSPCVPARASFASGLFGIHSGVVAHRGAGRQFRHSRRDPEREMFIRRLRRHGYHCATFSSFADRHRAHWFMDSWNEVHTHTLKRGHETADEVVDAVLPWLEQNHHREDLFLHVQFWDPHRNYTIPERYQRLFQDEPPPAWPDGAAIETHQDSYAPFSARMLFPFRQASPVESMPDRIRNPDDFRQFVDSYDGAVRFMDDQLGRLFARMEALGILEETAIIVSADHGEAMGEHGIYGDHVCADEAVHNIPMIIRWPGIEKQDLSFNHLVYNVDLVATICELCDVPVPTKWDGRSFAGLLTDRPYTPRDYLVWDHALYSVSRTVRTDRWLMMRNYHPGLVPLEPLELYDMEADPYMTNDVAADYPGVVKELDHLLHQWHLEQAGRPNSPPDPLPFVVETGPFEFWIPRDAWANHLSEIGRDDLRDDYLRRIGETP